MSTPDAAANLEHEGTTQEIPQYNIWMILFMFIWPAAWFMFMILVLVPLIWKPEPGEYLPTWIFMTVAILGPAAEFVVALVLLRREGYPLTISGLRDRARLRWPKGWKKWGLAITALVLAFAYRVLVESNGINLASIPGFIPPETFPPALNPNAEITSVEGFFPDVTLAGNWLFFIMWFIVFGGVNIIGEELYYRSFLLPKMRAVFGRWDWVANGVLFALKHVYQRWYYIGILGGSLAFAFIGGPIGSVYFAMVAHWLANNVMFLIVLAPTIFGGG